MATQYRFGDCEYAHFITFAVVNWMDALNRHCIKILLFESLKYCINEKGLKLHAWVIMSKLRMLGAGIKLQDKKGILKVYK